MSIGCSEAPYGASHPRYRAVNRLTYPPIRARVHSTPPTQWLALAIRYRAINRLTY